ncbi:hypothetical protein BZA77DRAFT_305153 [Pyronema omphalodes]|nr:hypothetical protein BZA77DRAFT_305153 [Pyronema omphalodes]
MSEVANHGTPKNSTAVYPTNDLLAKNCPVCREYFTSLYGFLQHTSTIHPYYHPERLDSLRSDVMIINSKINLLGSLEESQQSDLKHRVLLASQYAYDLFTVEIPQKPTTQGIYLTPEQDARIYRTLVQAFEASELRKKAMKQNISIPIPIIPAENADQPNQPATTTLLRPTTHRIEYHESSTLDTRNSAPPIFQQTVVPMIGIANLHHNNVARPPMQVPHPNIQPMKLDHQSFNLPQNTLTTPTFQKLAPEPSFSSPLTSAVALPPSGSVPPQIAAQTIAYAPPPGPSNFAISPPWTPTISLPITLPHTDQKTATAAKCTPLKIQPAVRKPEIKAVPMSKESESKKLSPLIHRSRVRKSRMEKNSGKKDNMVQVTLLRDGRLDWGALRKKKDLESEQTVVQEIQQ